MPTLLPEDAQPEGMADEYLTAPTTGYAEIVLATVPVRDDPPGDTIRCLSDPSNYTHALDFRESNA